MTAAYLLDRYSVSASDRDLLRAYVQRKSQPAFDALTRRYVDFVYAACCREVHDPDLAQDVTQAVFLVLARKAPSLRSQAALPAWLLQTARLASREALRKEQRRMHYESQAVQEQERQTQQASSWDQVEPLLNEALLTLKPVERQIILLRFFQGHSLRETGAVLGLSEDAARMRVSRALDKMRHALLKAGIVVSAATLASLLQENSAQAAPADLLAKILSGPFLRHSLLTLPNARSRDCAKGTLRAMNNILKWKFVALSVAGVVLPLSGLRLAKSAGVFQGRVPTSLAEGIRLQTPRPNPPAGPTALPGTQLPEAFTLVYDVTERVTMSRAIAQRMLDSVRTSYALAVRQGKMTQGEADRGYQHSMAGLLNTSSQQHYLVTISARDGKLLDRCDKQEEKDALTDFYAIYLHDGQQSLRYFNHNPVASITPGLNLWAAPCFPLPGLGIPDVPLLQNAKTPAASAFASQERLWLTGLVPSLHEVQGEQSTPNVIYRAGQIQYCQRNGIPQVLQIKAPHAQWDYTQHQRFAGVWLASQFHATDFDDAGRPLRVTEYQLTKASETPLDASEFAISAWLPANTTVSFYDNQGEHPFLYDPNKGDWQGQVSY